MLEQFGNIFTQMIILFASIGAGYVCKRLKFMDDSFDKMLSTLVLNVSLPALILSSLLDSDVLPEPMVIAEIFGLSIVSFVVLITVAFFATWALRIPDGHKGVFRFMMIFGNTGFVGYPVISAIFGSDMVVYAVVYNIPFNLIVFTLGVWCIASDNERGVKVRLKLKDILNPCNITCIIVMVLAFAGVHGVPVVGDALATLGNLTTPATLLIVGSSLANVPPKQLLGGPRLFIACAFRLLITPLIICGVMQFIVQGNLLAMLVLLAAMPVATNGTMLCYLYNGDAKSMAQGTFVTTVLSMLTIPLLATLVTTLF